MLRFNSVMLSTMQPAELVDFYTKVIGEPPGVVDEENGFHGWQVGDVFVGVLAHSEMAGGTKDPGRIMLNYTADDVPAEFERVKALGATVVRAPYEIGDGMIATLADPDGNYFQLMSPMEMD